TLREELAILDEEAGHCQRIADDLLSYARAGELTLETIEMEPFLRETARRYEMGALGANIECDLEDAYVEGDRDRLKQVISNLLNNAFQASPTGSGVRLQGRAGEEGYYINVIDHGPGVHASDSQRIFEPFYS